jgi:hypothetical protein
LQPLDVARFVARRPQRVADAHRTGKPAHERRPHALRHCRIELQKDRRAAGHRSIRLETNAQHFTSHEQSDVAAVGGGF